MAESPEAAVREYYAAYSAGDPDAFDDCVSPDYVDYGHNPPGRGPQGAKDDLAQAIEKVGGTVQYDIDALVSRDEIVAVTWTGHLPNGSSLSGLSLYVVTDGLVSEIRHTSIGAPPA